MIYHQEVSGGCGENIFHAWSMCRVYASHCRGGGMVWHRRAVSIDQPKPPQAHSARHQSREEKRMKLEP
jgi:hypothetical protein